MNLQIIDIAEEVCKCFGAIATKHTGQGDGVFLIGRCRANFFPLTVIQEFNNNSHVLGIVGDTPGVHFVSGIQVIAKADTLVGAIHEDGRFQTVGNDTDGVAPLTYAGCQVDQRTLGVGTKQDGVVSQCCAELYGPVVCVVQHDGGGEIVVNGVAEDAHNAIVELNHIFIGGRLIVCDQRNQAVFLIQIVKVPAEGNVLEIVCCGNCEGHGNDQQSAESQCNNLLHICCSFQQLVINGKTQHLIHGRYPMQ